MSLSPHFMELTHLLKISAFCTHSVFMCHTTLKIKEIIFLNIIHLLVFVTETQFFSVRQALNFK